MGDSALGPLQGLSRRKWLVGALALGASAAFVWYRVQDDAANASGTAGGRLLTFSPEEASIVLAIAEAVTPSDAVFPDIARTQVLRRFDEELFFTSEDVISDIRAAIQLIAWMPLAYGYMSRFQRLDLESRRDVFRRAHNSSVSVFRAASSGLRLMLQLMYFGHDASWQALGYDGSFTHLPQQLSEQRKFYAKAVEVKK